MMVLMVVGLGYCVCGLGCLLCCASCRVWLPFLALKVVLVEGAGVFIGWGGCCILWLCFGGWGLVSRFVFAA